MTLQQEKEVLKQFKKAMAENYKAFQKSVSAKNYSTLESSMLAFQKQTQKINDLQAAGRK